MQLSRLPPSELALEKRAYVYEKLRRYKPAIADYTTLIEKNLMTRSFIGDAASFIAC